MARTFLLGIDGGTWRILDSLQLPAFDRLRADATTGTLTSAVPPITFPAWKCLSTGKNPGKLGVFGFANFDRRDHTNRTNDATHFDSAELWDYLSAAGRRVGVVNVPSTYPPHEVNGVMVGGPNSGERGYVAPGERQAEIEGYGYRRLTSGHRLAFKAGGDRAVSAAREVIGSRFDATEALLEREAFDFFDLTLFCTDTIQHYYWDRPEVERTYRYLDDRLGDLLDLLGDDWNVVVVSDHGFRPIRGSVYLDSWLEEAGFLVRRDDGESLKRTAGLTTENAYAAIRRLGLERLVGRLPGWLVETVADSLSSAESPPVVDAVDPERSRAVYLHGGIYALDGTPAERAETAAAVADALDSFTDPRGDPVVSAVHRARDTYSGPHVDAAPDLVPVSRNYKFLGLSREGDVFNFDGEWRASHEMDGLFLASGPSFGERDGVELDICDVTPTLLHAMDEPVPGDVDGTVRRELLVPGAGSNREPSTRDPIAPPHGSALTDADRERIDDRLRDLGYVE